MTAEEDRELGDPLGECTSESLPFGVLLKHANPSSEDVSDLASRKESFGVAWVVLRLSQKTQRDAPPNLMRLNLPGCKANQGGTFFPSPGKLSLLLHGLPQSIEELTLGLSTVKKGALPVLCRFLQRVGGGEGEVEGIRCRTCRLKIFCFSTGITAPFRVPQKSETPTPEDELISLPEAKDIFQCLPASLETLSFHGTILHSNAMEALQEALLEGKFSGLRRLHLKGLGLSQANLDAFLGCLGGTEGIVSPSVCPSLEALEFEGNLFGPQSVQLLCTAVAQSTSLKEVSLAGCGIREASVQALADGILEGKLRQVEVLDLRRNIFGGFGAVVLSEALTTSLLPRLHTLVLQGNGLVQKGAEVLVEALSSPDGPPLRAHFPFGRFPVLILVVFLSEKAHTQAISARIENPIQMCDLAIPPK
uniref:Uncharacterized protein n=1 Tax=Chromera velia CCMP2878 TaxID=1169474 RepID=A0A0G4I1Z2_9ALVE|eukprot:Cvel_10277.t1-p1 / transcript=Cvel_10277.t1 / gene=Cvel_10277 / organism=Chromera_velia_CCMP2878 / gene_product=hypothetical protein / transcript_product=hypothetical protein / location=Cvel_scaffold616:70106-76248(+) / protein_length=419 / sequence_SO=supercontig / SO=protein_coding / is_pseudo=false